MFIMAIRNRFSGTWKGSPSGEYVSGMAYFGPRLSASMSIISSPKILLRLPRFTSSMMNTYCSLGFLAASRQKV